MTSLPLIAIMNESNRAFHAHSSTLMSNKTQSGGSADRNQKTAIRLNESLKTDSTWKLACKELNRIFNDFCGAGCDDFPDTLEVDALRQQLNDAIILFVKDGNADAYLIEYHSVANQLDRDPATYIM